MISADHTFDEVQHVTVYAIARANDHGVSLFKTCTAEVFRPVPIYENLKFSHSETRKDSAVHVSLSSSSLVKQPGTAGAPLPLLGVPEGLISTANDNRLAPAV